MGLDNFPDLHLHNRHNGDKVIDFPGPGGADPDSLSDPSPVDVPVAPGEFHEQETGGAAYPNIDLDAANRRIDAMEEVPVSEPTAESVAEADQKLVSAMREALKGEEGHSELNLTTKLAVAALAIGAVVPLIGKLTGQLHNDGEPSKIERIVNENELSDEGNKGRIFYDDAEDKYYVYISDPEKPATEPGWYEVTGDAPVVAENEG